MKLELRLMVGSDNISNGPLGQRPPPGLIQRSVLADILQHRYTPQIWRKRVRKMKTENKKE